MILKTEYEGTVFTLEFAVGRPLRVAHKGKHWPITTQCTIKRDGLIVGVGEVVKHEKDTNNPKYAKVYATKKAFKNAGYKIWKELRVNFWKQILAE